MFNFTKEQFTSCRFRSIHSFTWRCCCWWSSIVNRISNESSFGSFNISLHEWKPVRFFLSSTYSKVNNVSQPNDEGLTALHNAVCASNIDCVRFLVEYGCDINFADSDGWTPLHCAASCNNTLIVQYLVEHGASLYAMTYRDHETPADKCEETEDNYTSCSQYLRRKSIIKIKEKNCRIVLIEFFLFSCTKRFGFDQQRTGFCYLRLSEEFDEWRWTRFQQWRSIDHSSSRRYSRKSLVVGTKHIE